jgi:hypothetical protein
MNVEITRGRSDIYDILTHLTFILLNHIKYEIGFYWTMLVKYPVIGWNYNKPFLSKKIDTCRKKKAIISFCTLEGLLEVLDILIFMIGWKISIELSIMTNELLQSFWKRLGHHIHGEIWATNIKKS